MTNRESFTKFKRNIAMCDKNLSQSVRGIARETELLQVRQEAITKGEKY